MSRRPVMTEAERQRNRQKLWNEKQARAREGGPAAYAAFWWDSVRTVVRDAEREGNEALWNELSAVLHTFYVEHRR